MLRDNAGLTKLSRTKSTGAHRWVIWRGQLSGQIILVLYLKKRTCLDLSHIMKLYICQY